MNNEIINSVEQREERSKFGGILYLFPILFLLLLLHIMAYYKSEVFPFYSGGNLSLLKDLSFVLWLLVIIDLIVLPLLAFSCLIFIALLFMRSKIFPIGVIVLLVTIIILGILDLAANNFLTQYASEELKHSINMSIFKYFSRPLIYSVFVIPYLLMSTRVKDIFK